MKRLLWFLLFMGSVSCLYYCSKSVGVGAGDKIEDSHASSPGVGAVESSGVGRQGGSVCNCPGTQLSCRADCYLSDCCICWNPTVENGSCGCYFGVAKCITGPIGKSATYRKTHPVKLYTSRFSGFLDQLQVQWAETDSLRARYLSLLNLPGMTTVQGKDPYVEVPAENYVPFFDYYTAFMQKASPELQRWVIEYMNTQTARLR